MAKNKINRIKREKIETEEQMEIKRFIIILVVLVVLILGAYFFTRIFVTKDLFNNKAEDTKTTPGEINYNTTLIGSMLTKPEKEYYVLAYQSENIGDSVYYSGLVTNYKRNTDALKVYIADLSNELNKKYYDKNNVNTTSLDSLKLGDVTLLKISNGEISLVYTTEEDITKALEYVNNAK